MNVKILQQQQQQFLQQLQSSPSSSQPSTSSEVPLKLQVKMGAKEYADIRERMGKILSDIEDNGEDDYYDESCRRSKDQKNGYQQDNSNFGQVSSGLLPSLTAPSINAVAATLNRTQGGLSGASSSVPGSLSIFSRQASPKAAGDSRSITKETTNDVKNKTTSFWSSKTDSQGNLKIAAILKRRNQSVNVIPEKLEQQKSTEIPKEIKTLLIVQGQSQTQSAMSSQPSSPGNNNNTNHFSISGNTANVGSLLSSVADIGYMKHLRSMESRGSFHDELNKLEYRSHIQEQFGNSLFSNRNVLMNLKGQSIGAIPKKFDHIHITEAIIPTLFNSRNMSSSNSFRSKPLSVISNTSKVSQNYPQPLSTKASSSRDFSIKQAPSSTRASRTPSNATTPKNNMKQLQPPQTAQFSSSTKNDLILCATPSKRTTSQQQSSSSKVDQFTSGLQRTSSNFGVAAGAAYDKDSEPPRLTTAQMISTILGAGNSNNNTIINPFDNPSSHASEIFTHPSVSLKPIEFPSRKFVQPDVKNKVTKRQETANVRRWMDEKLQDLLELPDLSVNQIFTYFQNIFQASISEVLRQIGEECKEREVLIQEIWDSQVSLSEKIFIAISNQNQQSENASLKEITRLHKHYQFELQKQFTLVDEKTSLTKDLQAHLSREIQENRFVRKKAQKLEKNYKVINNQMTQLQEEYNIIFQENLAWLMNAKSINWETALEQKKKMLEEINLNRKMRNNLLKIGDEVRKDKLTIEEQAQKQEIDNLVNQFVIDRESNLPVELIRPDEEAEADEPFELDENKQPILRDFQRDESTSTEGLIEYADGETSMLKIQTFEAYSQTRKKKTNELAIQKDLDVAETEEAIVQTEEMKQNEYTQTHEVETLDMMVQCCLLDADNGIVCGQRIEKQEDQQQTRQPTVVPTIPLGNYQEEDEENEYAAAEVTRNGTIKQIAGMSGQVQQQRDQNKNSQQSSSNNRVVSSRGLIPSNRRVQEPTSIKQQSGSKQKIDSENASKVDKQIAPLVKNNSNNATGSPGLKSSFKINSGNSNQQIGTISPLRTRQTPGNHVKLSISSSQPLVKSSQQMGEFPATQNSSQALMSKQRGKNSRGNDKKQEKQEDDGGQLEQKQQDQYNRTSSDEDDSNSNDGGYNNNNINNGDAVGDDGEDVDVDEEDDCSQDNESYFLTGLDGQQQTKQMNRMPFTRKKSTQEPSINFRLSNQDNKSNTYLRSGRQLSPSSSGYSIPSEKQEQQSLRNLTQKIAEQQQKQDKQQQQQQGDQELLLQEMDIKKSMELSEKVLQEIEAENPNSPVEPTSSTNHNKHVAMKVQLAQVHNNNNGVNTKIPDGINKNSSSNNNRIQSDTHMLLQLFSDASAPRNEIESQVRGYVEEISVERQTLNATISILQKQLESMKLQQRITQTAEQQQDRESFQTSSGKVHQRQQQQSYVHYGSNNRDEVSEIVSPSSVKTPFSDTTNQIAKSIFRPSNNNNNNHYNHSQQSQAQANQQPYASREGNNSSPKSMFGVAVANASGSSPKSNQSRYLNTINSQRDSFSHRSSLSVTGAQNNNNFSSASKKVSIFGNGKPTNNSNNYNSRADSSSGSSSADENSITQKDEDIMNMSRSRIQGNNSGIAAKRNWNLEKLAISQIKQEQIAMNSSYINNSVSSPRVLNKQSPFPGVANISRGSFSAQFVPDSPRSSISAVVGQKNKTYSANTDSALAMRRKLKGIRGHIKAPKNALKYLPQIYKMMNSVFNDNLKTVKSNDAILNPLYVQVYEYFLYLFGLRKVAEIKMAQVLEQCLLMAEDYLSINIFMSMYISDMKSTELDFVCKTMYLLSELSQGVRVEKTNTNKAKVLQAIPQLFEATETQKSLCKILNNFMGKGSNNNSGDAVQLLVSQQEINERRNSLFGVMCSAPGWTAEQLAEFTNLKLDLFEIMRVLLRQYKEQKKQIGMEYFGTFYSVMTSVEHSLIDEEGIRFLANLSGFTDQNTHQLLMNFRSKSIMSEMSYDQFLLFANRLDIFKTSQLASSLGVHSNQKEDSGIQQLSELKEFWIGNKQTIISQIISDGNYTNYVKNVIEKMDILVALLDSDELDSNNQSYLLKHQLSFMICQAILKKVAGWENQ